MMIESFGPGDTYSLGQRLGREAKKGDIFCLNGDLGVGKTVFTQGFAAGLGITEPVNSPTFTIPCTILTFTGSATSAKWTRWVMRTVSTAMESR